MAETIRIDDPDDPRVAAYRDVKERDLVGRQGLFVAEGEVVLRAVARGGRHALQSVLVAEKRVDDLADVLSALDAPVYAAGQAVMDAITGFHIHRGILAIGRRGTEPDPDVLLAGLPERSVVLGLHGIANHDNMGGAFRNAAAFGAGAVILDPTCCDPLYRKAIRTSVGAALTVPFATSTDMLSLFGRHGFKALALSPAGAIRLVDLRPSPRTAVLLGAEGPGLPEAVMARTKTVSIPMASGFDSLNVATTAGIVLHHLCFAPGGGGPEAPNPVP